MGTTAQTKASMLRRLKGAGFDLETVVAEDYPRVQARLGWAESTFRIALSYLGKPGGNLSEGFRDYLPTDEEMATVIQELGTFGIALAYIGCRYSELWDLGLSLDDSTLVINTKKRGEKITLDLAETPETVREALIQWVEEDSLVMTPHIIRRRWKALKEAGKLSPKCVPHSFRHRLVSHLLDAGCEITQVAKAVGHKSINTTYRYRHNSPRVQSSLRNEVFTNGHTPGQ